MGAHVHAQRARTNNQEPAAVGEHRRSVTHKPQHAGNHDNSEKVKASRAGMIERGREENLRKPLVIDPGAVVVKE